MGTTTTHLDDVAEASPRTSTDPSTSSAVIGFGTAAAITVLFNTLLAWVKDAVDPLNTFMASLTGSHWITHGLVDVAVFLVLGIILSLRQIGRHGDGIRLAWQLVAATLLAGGSLSLWFLIF